MLSSIKANIVDYLHGVFVKDRKKWVSGKTIETLERFKKHRPSTIGRRCRELAEDGIIDRYCEEHGLPVFYHWKPIKQSLVFRGKNKRKLTH